MEEWNYMKKCLKLSSLIWYRFNYFFFKGNHYEPELADYLGKFTNEIKGDNFIEEFVSAGPKNYGYKQNNGQTSCKI